MGSEMADHKNGIDKTHAALVIRELARIRVASLLLQNKTPDEDLYIKIDPYYFTNSFDTIFNMIKDTMKLSQRILTKVGGYERLSAWIDAATLTQWKSAMMQIECCEPKLGGVSRGLLDKQPSLQVSQGNTLYHIYTYVNPCFHHLTAK